MNKLTYGKFLSGPVMLGYTNIILDLNNQPSKIHVVYEMKLKQTATIVLVKINK